MAKATLSQGIEVILREAIPEIANVVDVTDHADGDQPVLRAGPQLTRRPGSRASHAAVHLAPPRPTPRQRVPWTVLAQPADARWSSSQASVRAQPSVAAASS